MNCQRHEHDFKALRRVHSAAAGCSWAVVCLVRAKDEHQNSLRNAALASAMLPYATLHNISILFFSEDNFSDETVNEWKKSFVGVSDEVRLINVTNKGYNTPKGKKFGFKWMCKFFTVDIFEYLQDYTYYLRVDSDNILSPLSYDIFKWTETNNVEYGYVLRKLEPHQLTVNTLPTFIQKYLQRCPVRRHILEPPLTRDFVFNFYNNFHLGKVSFFNRPDVRHFLVATNSSHLHANRWGDSTIQAYAIRIFMNRSSLCEIPNITYHHMSHGNALVSSDPRFYPEVPEHFPPGEGDRYWDVRPELSAKSRVVSRKSGLLVLPFDRDKT